MIKQVIKTSSLPVACTLALALFGSGSAVADPGAYQPVTDARLANAAKDDGWLMYRRDWSGSGYAPFNDINTGNVANLKPAWDFKNELEGHDVGHEAPPIVNGDYMFITGPRGKLWAFEAATGKPLWKYEHDLSNTGLKTVCCDIVNRGVALYGNNVYLATLNNDIVALDAKTGKVVWKKTLEKPDLGYAITQAPLVAKDKVLVGISGGEYGIRGYITALDAKTGATLWKRHTTAAPNEPGGNSWPKGAYKTGGGAPWLTGTYDPGTDTLFWGVGNPGPWLATMRPGDSLYTDSVLALDPATGAIKWYYQYTPGDTWDYDGSNEQVLTDITYGGKSYKALVSASRNGWLYVIDRTNGKLIYAEKFAHATSVKEMKDGKPVTDDNLRPTLEKEVFTCPSFLGGKNWWPVAINPELHSVFIPTLHTCMTIKGAPATYKAGLPYLGATFRVLHDPDNKDHWGSVQSIDLDTGKQVWSFPSELPWNSGMLATAGGLVFSGSADGHLYAFDAKTGKVLWKSPQATSGFLGVPSTWRVNGKQYVGIWAGWGGASPIWGGEMAEDPKVKAIPSGGHLYVFAL
ncbi:MAG: methanol/ethanol family PQQ-dependent dehydrogenase [Proteobacteria bacterium]|nr:methanol/ethanol family PQQ-dependent dehydrogenase [Pseudomonadota bacterium]